MGEVIEKIVIKVLPDLEVTVKGTDIEMFEIGAKVMKALRDKGLHPDVQIVIVNALEKVIHPDAKKS